MPTRLPAASQPACASATAMSNFPPTYSTGSQRSSPLSSREFRSDVATLTRQAKSLASLIRSSKFFVAFTGAGISTAAGLPDYRGAGGIMTARARGSQEPVYRNPLGLTPSLTHMSLLGLERAGLLKRLISQNTDGLHRRSGFPPDKLAELHGNTAIEWCPTCGSEYFRDFRVRQGLPEDQRTTERSCRTCLAAGTVTKLRHSLVLFGYPLRPDVLNQARTWCQQADLCLVLGSSLTVNPAARLPLECLKEGNNGKLVICNLQPTPRDLRASMRLFTDTDNLMSMLMRELDVPVPQWSMERRIRFMRPSSPLSSSAVSDFPEIVRLEPLDSLGNQLSCIKSVQISGSNLIHEEPFDVPVGVDLELTFFGHFNEPPLRLKLPSSPADSFYGCELRLVLDVERRQWLADTVGHIGQDLVAESLAVC